MTEPAQKLYEVRDTVLWIERDMMVCVRAIDKKGVTIDACGVQLLVSPDEIRPCIPHGTPTTKGWSRAPAALDAPQPAADAK